MVQSRNDSERYDLRKKFIDEVTAAGGTVEEAADKTLSLSVHGFNLSVDFAELQEEYDRTGDLSKYERLLAAVLTSGKAIPSWEEARSNVYPVFYAASMDPGDVVTEPMTAQFDCAYFVEIGDRREWIDASMLTAWKIDAAALRLTAAANLRKQIECADLMTETDDDGIRIGYFDTDFFYPSSFLIAPDFRRKITDAGFMLPVFVYMPTAGVLEIIQDCDVDAAIELYGNSILTEYFGDPHPVTTELLEVGEDDIRTAGFFEADGDRAVFVPEEF